MLPGKAYQNAEGNCLLDVFSDDGEQQIGYQRAPYLYLDGILIVAQKIFQGEVY